MPVLAKCPNSHKINVPDKFIGKKVKCPKCEAEFVVTTVESSSAVTPAPATAKPSQPTSLPKAQPSSQPNLQRSPQPAKALANKPATPVAKPIPASPVVSEPTTPFDPFSSELPESNNDPFADPFGNSTNDPFGNSTADPFADPFAQSASPAADPWATQGGYNSAYAGSGMQYASPATHASAASSSESNEGSPQPLIRTIMYVVGGCFGLFAFVMVLFVVITLVGISKPSKSVASTGRDVGNPPPQATAPVLPTEPANNNANNSTSETSPDATSSSNQDLEDMSDEEKKKINVFGYDSNKRARLVEFLAKNNVNKLKGNVSAMMVAAKLMKAAKTLKISPDENKVIAFPKDTKFEQHFNDDTLMKVIELEKLPDVFLPLIKKYEKGEASPEEKELAFFVLAAFYLTELK